MDPATLGIGLMTNFIQQDMAARKAQREQFLAQQEANRMHDASKFQADSVFLQSYPTSGVAQTSFAKYGGWVRRMKKMGNGGKTTAAKANSYVDSVWNSDPDVLAFRNRFVQKFGEEPARDPAVSKYDYSGAIRAGIRPIMDPADDSLYHWHSSFKLENHPNRFVKGVDTKNNTLVLPKGLKAANLPRFSMGGSPVPDYIAEGGEVVDFVADNVPQAGRFGNLQRLSSGTAKIEGDSHDDPSGGVEMTGGERVFSDRLYASNSFSSKLRKL